MIAIEADNTFEIPIDPKQPTQRVLVCRHGTLGDWRRFSERHRQLADLKEDADYIKEIVSLIGDRVLAVKGFGAGTPTEKPAGGWGEWLQDQMSHYEARQLLHALPLAAFVTENEKKRSESPLPSNAAGSATAAGVA